MIRLIELAVAGVICFCIAIILWLIKGKMVLPVKNGKDIDLKMVITAANCADRLEQTAAAALWIKENCAPDMEIVINACNLNETGIKTAKLTAKKYSNQIFFENN